jgi:hypothetical protein
MVASQQSDEVPGPDKPPIHGDSTERPIIPPGVEELFLRPRGECGRGESLVFRPAIVGVARIHFIRATANLDHWNTEALVAVAEDPLPKDVWENAQLLDPEALDFCNEQPASDAKYVAPPPELSRPKSYSGWKSDLKNHLYRTRRLRLWQCSTLKMKSLPGESEGDFRIRLRQRAIERRDLELEKLRNRFAPKLRSLKERIRKAQQTVSREQSQLSQQTLQTALSFGTTVIGALFGRKLTSSTNVSRTATSMRQAGRVAREKGDVQRALENVQSLQQKLTELEEECREKTRQIRDDYDPLSLELAELPIRPRKSDLSVKQVSLLWTPWCVDSAGIAKPLFLAKTKPSH